MNPHLSRHDSLNTSMIDATPPCPIMIYEIKIDNLFVVNQLCLLEDPRYDHIGAGEQRWISNEIISELVNNVVAAHEVGSSAGSTGLRGISVTPTFQAHIGSSVFMMIDVTSPCPIMLETGAELR